MTMAFPSALRPRSFAVGGLVLAAILVALALLFAFGLGYGLAQPSSPTHIEAGVD